MSQNLDDSLLQRIQQLQFKDKPAAESLLLQFVQMTFPDLQPQAVELRPLAVSLNSFNGFLTLKDGSRLFFKTHVEPGSVIDEYYNSTLLANAGYAIIQPRYASTEYGKQFLIYEVIESPSVFDVAHALEIGQRDDLPALAAAQAEADDRLLQIYMNTLEPQSAEQSAKAVVHQLFHHRLGARYQQFYAGKLFELPAQTLQWEELCRRRWHINGREYRATLGELIEQARRVIQPSRAGLSIIGHGDAHNGNVFFTPQGIVYFDPAFGGRHHPLLDLAKPFFHNVFATWMYHPHEVVQALDITLRDDGTAFTVEHNYTLSACREMFLHSKAAKILGPFVKALRAQGKLDAEWRTYLKSALLCCPLLTMNLADRGRFPNQIALLGLCYVMEMGGATLSGQGNPLNDMLDSLLSS